MASEEPRIVQFQLQARWEGVSDAAIVVANQMLIQTFQGNVLMTFGQVAPPALMGTPEEQEQQAQGLEAVPIRTIARFSVPLEPFREMAKAFQTTLDGIDAQLRDAKGASDGDAT